MQTCVPKRLISFEHCDACQSMSACTLACHKNYIQRWQENIKKKTKKRDAGGHFC